MSIVRFHGLLLVLTLGSILLPRAYAEHDNTISLDIGGRIKLDAIYNTNSVSTTRTSRVSGIPTFM